jgi:hypothetical protein
LFGRRSRIIGKLLMLTEGGVRCTQAEEGSGLFKLTPLVFIASLIRVWGILQNIMQKLGPLYIHFLQNIMHKLGHLIHPPLAEYNAQVGTLNIHLKWLMHKSNSFVFYALSSDGTTRIGKYKICDILFCFEKFNLIISVCFFKALTIVRYKVQCVPQLFHIAWSVLKFLAGI